MSNHTPEQERIAIERWKEDVRKAEKWKNIGNNLRDLCTGWGVLMLVVFPIVAYFHNTQTYELQRDLRLCEYDVNELNRKVRGR